MHSSTSKGYPYMYSFHYWLTWVVHVSSLPSKIIASLVHTFLSRVLQSLRYYNVRYSVNNSDLPMWKLCFVEFLNCFMSTYSRIAETCHVTCHTFFLPWLLSEVKHHLYAKFQLSILMPAWNIRNGHFQVNGHL